MPTDLAGALAAYRDSLHPARPATRRTRRRWAALVVLGGAVLAGGAAAGVLPGDPPALGAAPPLVAGAAPEASATSTTVAVADPAGPLGVPPAASWRAWSSPVVRTWLPTIPGAGPTDSGRLAGFTRSPAGALAAAVSLHPTIYYTRDRAAWAGLAEHRVVWAPGQRQALTRALEPVWDVADPDPVGFEVAGYRLVFYTPDRAQLRAWWAWQFPDGTRPILGALVTVVWRDDDWWLFFDEPGMDMRALQAADSYVPWGRP